MAVDTSPRPSRREDVPTDKPETDPKLTGLAPQNVKLNVTESPEQKKLLESSSEGAELSAEDKKTNEAHMPPVPKPADGTDLYATPGGYQVTPEGVSPEQVGQAAISRS